MRHTQLALNRPVTTVMVFLAVLAVGLISAKLLRLENFPDITFPGMQVTIPYPGSTPEEMEQLVVRPVEEALATLSGIEEIQATARPDEEHATARRPEETVELLDERGLARPVLAYDRDRLPGLDPERH